MDNYNLRWIGEKKKYNDERKFGIEVVDVYVK